MNGSDNYSVRESARARRVRITLCPREGVVVVVPRDFDRDAIPKLVQEKRGWIERSLRRIEAQRVAATETGGGRPERLLLRAIGQEWDVDYVRSAAPGVKLRESSGGLVLEGCVGDDEVCAEALKRWLRGKARERLIPALEETARSCGIEAIRTSVRWQRSRWGSCSPKRTISLNGKLLFVPEDLLRHVIVHELCHIVHLNHSKKFWKLVQQHEPDFRDKKERLRGAWAYVPAWLDYR